MRVTRIKNLVKPKTTSLNLIEIDSNKILTNLSYLQSLKPHDALFPVLKSNAYGHGIELISQILRNTNVPYICVDSFPEYQLVRDRSNKKVLVLGETLPENYRYYNPKHATLAIYNLKTIEYLADHTRHCTVHLFLNTGMNREGIQAQHLPQLLQKLSQARHIKVEGVMSHLANADEIDSAYNLKQISRFKKMLQTIRDAGIKPKRIHIGNSAGIVKVNDELFNARRPGIGLYGYNPLHHDDPQYHQLLTIQSALRVSSTIVSVQQLEPGDIVSYGGSYQAESNETIATIPFGYQEGLPRAVSNNRTINWQQHQLPQVGRVCMNLSSFSTQQAQPHIGDRVEIIGRESNAPNSVYQLAKKCNTIPYEVITRLDSKIKRVLTQNKKLV